MKTYVLFVSLFISVNILTQTTSKFIDTLGYKNCVQLKNSYTDVILEPNCAGRILVYALNGKNVLYVDEDQNGFVFEEGKPGLPAGKHLCAGRFDIGPEYTKPGTGILWRSSYDAKIIDNKTATLTSPIDPKEKFQVIREFVLNDTTSQLKVTQTIINHSDKTVRYCHWSRTLATGYGIAIVPVRKPNRFPAKYICYEKWGVANLITEPEENVYVDTDIVVIKDVPLKPKFVFDSDREWMAYLSTNNLLYVKRFPYFAEKIYGEATGTQASVWYNKKEMVEIEPIGPWEDIQPGKQIRFTETWYLFEKEFPKNRMPDLKKIQKLVTNLEIL